MKYSIIIPYRDREEHLRILVPRLQEVFELVNYEIIVSEQDNWNSFRRGNMRNEGARVATGDILIFHDVDYYPQDVDNYYDGKSDVFLPVHRAIFTYNDLREKPLNEVPGGYRHFRTKVDDNFFGGVLSFRREAFFAVRGFNPTYVGWGLEDADLRERVTAANFKMARSTSNLFYALDHIDSGPPPTDKDFQTNTRKFHTWRNEAHLGINSYHIPTVKQVDSPVAGVTTWLKVTDIDPKITTNVVFSQLEFDD
jgi:hypothetical protein